MQRRQRILFLLFGVLAAVLFVVDLSVGAVPIPIREVLAALTGSGNDPVTTKIILNIRLLKAVVALLAGAALAVSGLQMQTLFRNPLAGPYVLGISSGASLGVAIFLLGAPLLGLTGHPLISTLGIAGAAWIGSALILMLIAAVSRRIKDIMVISHPGHDVFVGCRSRRADPAIPEQRSRPQIFSSSGRWDRSATLRSDSSVCCFLPSFSDSCWPSRSSNL